MFNETIDFVIALLLLPLCMYIISKTQQFHTILEMWNDNNIKQQILYELKMLKTFYDGYVIFLTILVSLIYILL